MLAMEKEINTWYARLAKNNDISFAEAKKLLSKNELAEFHWTVREYIKKGKANFFGDFDKELENASARVHISRLEALKVQMKYHVNSLYAKENNMITTHLINTYEDVFYNGVFSIQQGLSVGWNLAKLDEQFIEKVIQKPWAADGVNFSQRIWKDHTKLINFLNTNLTQALIKGDNPQDLIEPMMKRFKVSANSARTLIVTETAAVSSMADLDMYKEMDVDEYEIIATLDYITSEICREMDGKVFQLSDYAIGVTAPPFHPNCRSTTASYQGDTGGERIARGHDGKSYYVPADMTYREWEKKYVVDALDRKGQQTFENYTDIIGKENMPKLVDFAQMWYNKGEEWNSLVRSSKTIDKIKSKERWSPEFKEKAIRNYWRFKNTGVEMSDHAMARFLERNRKTDKISFKSVVNTSKEPFNYIQADGKNIKFYNELCLVYNEGGSDIVSLLYRRHNSKNWSAL